MMTASDVLEVLGRLEAVGLRVWVDGGWGGCKQLVEEAVAGRGMAAVRPGTCAVP